MNRSNGKRGGAGEEESDEGAVHCVVRAVFDADGRADGAAVWAVHRDAAGAGGAESAHLHHPGGACARDDLRLQGAAADQRGVAQQRRCDGVAGSCWCDSRGGRRGAAETAAIGQAGADGVVDAAGDGGRIGVCAAGTVRGRADCAAHDRLCGRRRARGLRGGAGVRRAAAIVQRDGDGAVSRRCAGPGADRRSAGNGKYHCEQRGRRGADD